MTISYKWLSEYLPVTIEPERLSRILTSIGLEVESMEKYEEAKGGLKGLVIGEVLSTEKHPNADKLTLTKVNIGNAEPLQIVCGAPNVAAGQKVVVAPVGTTIYPTNGEPLTMKVAKIRSVESYGMICAEDEIGVSDDHSGIMVLDTDLKAGTAAFNRVDRGANGCHNYFLTSGHISCAAYDLQWSFSSNIYRGKLQFVGVRVLIACEYFADHQSCQATFHTLELGETFDLEAN